MFWLLLQYAQDVNDSANDATSVSETPTKDSPAHRLFPKRVIYFLSALMIEHTLERAWGMGWRRLNVDSPFNRFTMDFSFDEDVSDDQWLLLPERDVLQMLEEQSNRPATRDTVIPKLSKLLRYHTPIYKYYFVPRNSLRDKVIIERPYPGHAPIVHTYPFSTLGPITSHARPQYVIWGTVMKWNTFNSPEDEDMRLALRQILALNAPQLGGRGDKALILLLVFVYDYWKAKRPFPNFFHHTRATRRFHATYGVPPAVDDHQEAYFSGEESHGLEQTSVDAERVVQWCTESDLAARESGGWETCILNDPQIADYTSAPASDNVLPPLTAKTWREWRALWRRPRGKRFNTSRFSSNDWAALEHHTYLPVVSL
ncbi:hypothetical protein CONPUDRAFT_167136 [Coniophora puteana RWD-64-598 SS2]|uniref:Uncharacterized protein n=1 Tax=Coniophora puteana (strain RWD-64-598) TaxID=741705 RepID=A0A5M3MLC8_CONPW|nr:uncharacterized protein CONPUDRAFT_167136 [Coniophora puteana RWD-64-598 SS2]EIW79381.1 hypothetical protein CONPUDRAFT_167136 [Coniophora puteana RWD-64-598 SS2]